VDKIYEQAVHVHHKSQTPVNERHDATGVSPTATSVLQIQQHGQDLGIGL
jgi:hypothetical protein